MFNISELISDLIYTVPAILSLYPVMNLDMHMQHIKWEICHRKKMDD
mgnify:CR=1 FL=1